MTALVDIKIQMTDDKIIVCDGVRRNFTVTIIKFVSCFEQMFFFSLTILVSFQFC